jgi:hypothetical protein
MLEKGLIPATIHYTQPLPEFDLNSSKLTIPVETGPWPATGLRRISVSSDRLHLSVFVYLLVADQFLWIWRGQCPRCA